MSLCLSPNTIEMIERSFFVYNNVIVYSIWNLFTVTIIQSKVNTHFATIFWTCCWFETKPSSQAGIHYESSNMFDFIIAKNKVRLLLEHLGDKCLQEMSHIHWEHKQGVGVGKEADIGHTHKRTAFLCVFLNISMYFSSRSLSLSVCLH